MSDWRILPSDEDIMHRYHKYIDRIRGKNGKWRYIYDRAKVRVKSTVGIYQKEHLKNAKRKENWAKDDWEFSKQMNQENRADHMSKERIQQWDGTRRTFNDYQKAKNTRENAQELYNKTLMGKFDQIKDTGKKAFDSFISLFNKKSDEFKITSVTNKGVKYNKLNYRAPISTYEVSYGYDERTKGSQYTPSYNNKKKKNRR